MLILPSQVSSGQLLVEGEKEALEGKDTVYFTLTAERNHKEGSAEQTHFRLAESQFYRLLSGTNNWSLLFPFYFSFLSLYLSLLFFLSFQFISHSSLCILFFTSLSLSLSLSLCDHPSLSQHTKMERKSFTITSIEELNDAYIINKVKK